MGHERTRTRLGAVLALCFGVAASSCGSRSSLVEPTPGDAGSPGEPCEPPQIDAPCALDIENTAAGSEVWSASFDVGTAALIGPFAADASGSTYFVARLLEPGSSQRLVTRALADGAEVWQAALPVSGKHPTYSMLLNNAGALVMAIDNRAHAFASGRAKPPRCAWWPTPQGGPDGRACARGI
ncbi:MAG: hypothetical protein IPI67_18005 [Myxococcales bacterium]|nr:hypothetical protein [Myxococcales bacterium]